MLVFAWGVDVCSIVCVKYRDSGNENNTIRTILTYNSMWFDDPIPTPQPMTRSMSHLSKILLKIAPLQDVMR